MNFSELNFDDHPSWDGVQAKHFFDNGYGVSVIKSSNSYGGGLGLYELAVLKGVEDEWQICYDTPITDDVIGHLSESDVEKLLNEIAALT
jgi:hypothetical protein